jgi:hypothetical protein
MPAMVFTGAGAGVVVGPAAPVVVVSSVGFEVVELWGARVKAA